MIMVKGAKKRTNMMIDLTIRGVLPNLLILLSFKYAVTRAFSVEEKSDFADLEKEIVLIIEKITH